jgi:hypothetical protein
MAGKQVKCPKCQKVIPVAAPKAPAAKPPAAKPPAAKPAAAKPAAPNPPGGQDAMAILLDSAGLKKREGIFCPGCDRPLPTGSAICVGCGYNLQAGSKIEGFEVETKEFGNKRLAEAADMMAREVETEKRLLKAGMPWWMMLAIILGVLFMMSAILLKMDVNTSGKVSSVPILAKFQSASFGPVIAFSIGGAACLVGLFALFAIQATAFKESIQQGLLCTLTVVYVFYYMFSRMKSRKLGSTVAIFWISAILAGICLGYSLPKI